MIPKVPSREGFMAAATALSLATTGEGFYEITDQIRHQGRKLSQGRHGVLFAFLLHTSCALTINEAYDPAARIDMENFLKKMVPRHQTWFTHTTEGPDDSPSHMKSLLLHQSLTFLVEKGEVVLGTWQGVYLAEFRDSPHQRQVLLKFMPDPES